MASVFGHALAAVALGTSFVRKLKSWKFWLLGIFCSIFPDIDVVGFRFNIAYESFWGHRGFTHSLLFALLFGMLVTLVFYQREIKSKTGLLLILYFFICTASHAVLDAMTTGGYGIAFFSPFDNSRYFLPWREIQVSPIGIDKFFGEWGKRVLLSEAIWIGIPSAIIIIINTFIRKIRKS